MRVHKYNLIEFAANFNGNDTATFKRRVFKFRPVHIYISLHFLPIPFVKLDFCRSVFWFFMFQLICFLFFIFSVLCFGFNVIS